MKRLLLIVPVMGVLLLVAAAPASAQRAPTRTAVPPFDVTYPVGQICTFAVEVVSVVQQEVQSLWSNPDGSPNHAIVAGRQVAQFTNLDNGASVTLNLSGSASIVFNADGSVTITEHGPNGISLFPTDDPPGPATIVNYGLVVLTVSATGKLTIVSTTGTSDDVCAMIG